MIALRLVLVLAGSAWLAGNLLLLLVASVLFGPGLAQFSAGRHGAGTVFALCLGSWSHQTTILAVAVAVAVLVLAGRCLGARRRWSALLYALVLGALLGSHVWGMVLLARGQQLLPTMAQDAAAAARFAAMHHDSLVAFSGESLSIAALAAVGVIGLVLGPPVAVSGRHDS